MARARRPGRHRARLDHRPRGARARAAQLRRRRASRRRRRRQRRPRLARGRRAGQRPRHGRRCSRRRAAPGVKRIVYASTIWVYSDCADEAVDEDTLLPAPTHLYTSTKLAGELYCKAYQELYGIDYTILRFGIPYGPRAREAAVDPGVRQQGVRGRAADAGRRRQPVAAVRLRRGSRRRRRARARRRRDQPRLQPRQRRERHDQADRRDRPGADRRTSRSSTRRPVPATSAARSSRSERAERELGWTAATPFSEGVRRYVDWRREQAASCRVARGRRGDPRRRARRRGAAAPGPDHLRRHRRGPRPAGPRGRARVPATRIPTRRSRSSTGCRRWARS